MLGTAVLTVNRNRPSWVISTQQGAVCRSGNGELPIEARAPFRLTWKADTVPALEPPCAFETNSCDGLVGLNSLPNGPGPCAAKGEPGAGARRPSGRTAKLSISEVPTRVPARLVPVGLNSTSPGCDPCGSATLEPLIELSRPDASSLK